MKSSISYQLLTTLKKNITIVCQFLEKNMRALYLDHTLNTNMFNSIKLTDVLFKETLIMLVSRSKNMKSSIYS